MELPAQPYAIAATQQAISALKSLDEAKRISTFYAIARTELKEKERYQWISELIQVLSSEQIAEFTQKLIELTECSISKSSITTVRCPSESSTCSIARSTCFKAYSKPHGMPRVVWTEEAAEQLTVTQSDETVEELLALAAGPAHFPRRAGL